MTEVNDIGNTEFKEIMNNLIKSATAPRNRPLLKPKPIPTNNPRKIANIASQSRYAEFYRRAGFSEEVDAELLEKILKVQCALKKNFLIEENLTEDAKYKLAEYLIRLVSLYFRRFSPGAWNPVHKNPVIKNTIYSYNYKPNTFSLSKIVETLTERKIIDVCLLANRIINNVTKESIGEDKENVSNEEFLGALVSTEFADKAKSNNTTSLTQMEIDQVEEAIGKFQREGKIISILSETEAVYADILKLEDKYTIRLGDGERFVASDKVKITFRDPSNEPAWAVWFLDAVPLNKVPDLTQLFFMPKEEWEKMFPEPLENYPIVCHASLWSLPANKTGVLLHTAWNNIAVTYRWTIDKPMEVARIMFKAVSHPAHIARNFGMAPQAVKPGNNWF